MVCRPPGCLLRLDVGSSKVCWRRPTCSFGAGYNLARCNLKSSPPGLLFSFCPAGKRVYLNARGHTLPLALPHASVEAFTPARNFLALPPAGKRVYETARPSTLSSALRAALRAVALSHARLRAGAPRAPPCKRGDLHSCKELPCPSPCGQKSL